MAKGRSRSRGTRGAIATANRIHTVELPLQNHISFLNSLLKQARRANLSYDRRFFNPGDPIYQTNYKPGRILRHPKRVLRVHRRGRHLSKVMVFSHRSREMPSATGVSYRTILRENWTFADPKRTIICVQRKRRKEVLFAKGKAGRGGMRRPRWNYYSNIEC